MKNNSAVLIFLVDDDALFLKSLEIGFIQETPYRIMTYAKGEDCINALSEKPDIIILDYLLDGIDKNAMNGIQTLDKIKAVDAGIPVIMLSAQDKIKVAVNCMHHKAYDYVVKSETAFIRLQKLITIILTGNKMEKQLNWYMDRM